MTWEQNASLTAVEQALNALMNRHPITHGWVLEAKSSAGRQSLLMGSVGNAITAYQDRDVTDHVFTVELYVPIDDQTKMGTAKGNIDPFFDLESQLDTLFNNAQLAGNPYFKLPEPPTDAYPVIEAADPDLLNHLDQTHEGLVNRISTHCQTLNTVTVNSAELFSNHHAQLYKTSTGIRASKLTTDLYFEVAMEKAPGPNDQEVLKYWHFIGLKDANIEECLDSVARETALTEGAQLPPSKPSATVLIDGYAISKMMAAVVSKLNGRAEYSKAPHLKTDDVVSIGELDKNSDFVSIAIDPTVPHMAKSGSYTNDGLIAQKAQLIENNTVMTQILDSRMAQYLNKPQNDINGNIVVSLGTQNKEALLAENDDVIEILDFSSLLINPTSMTWSSEIKLGLHHKKGEPDVILKGGIVSGNVQENLSGFKFSNQESRRNTTGGYFEAANGYVGPEHMLIWKGVTIAGHEEV
jgi:predicted Zn-dependent protease